MVNLECKFFYSERCGHSKRFKTDAWKKLSEIKELDGNNLSFELIELNKENESIFKEYGVTSYPRTYLKLNDRKLLAILGNKPFETCLQELKKAIGKITSNDADWSKHLEEEKKSQAAAAEKRMQNAFIPKFLEQPLIKAAFNEFIRLEKQKK